MNAAENENKHWPKLLTSGLKHRHNVNHLVLVFHPDTDGEGLDFSVAMDKCL